MPLPEDQLSKRLRLRIARLTPSLKQVALYIDTHRLQVLTATAVELAEAVGTSDATVIRAVQALGFIGLPELRAVIESSVGRGMTAVDNMRRTHSTVPEKPNRMVQSVLSSQQEALDKIKSSKTQQEIASAIKLVSLAKRVCLYGVGPSSYLAGYAGALLLRQGWKTHLLTATGSILADQLLEVREGDVVIALAYGSASNEVSALFSLCKRLSVPIVLISDSLDEDVSRGAAVTIGVPRGKSGEVALHGVTLIAIEALVIELASLHRERAIAQLERLAELRKAVASGKYQD